MVTRGLVRILAASWLLAAIGTGCPPPSPGGPPPPPPDQIPAEDCGDVPELPYTCTDGSLPCDCVVGGNGVGQWRCHECDGYGSEGEEEQPPIQGGAYCDANPNATVCAKDAACIACHGLATSSTSGGIENPHAWSYVACVDCHGGVGFDPVDRTRRLSQDEAHVPMPESMRVSVEDYSTPQRDKYGGKYLALAGVERLPGGDEWLRFRNPGDLRVVDNTCSATGCHAGMGETVRRSTMATAVGKLDGLIQGLGVPRATDLVAELGSDSYGKHLATYGATDVDDPDWDMDASPPGSVPHLVPLEFNDREQLGIGTYTEIDLHKETVNKLCGTCHLGTNGKNQQ
ncbi:MAG: hypothetical protein IT383_09430, partial [Deltaproteobacteria bacterium]|nr:hypothetical protein [Deltaproteobacteria bacterium]